MPHPHPHAFRKEDTLADWPDCRVEVRCPECRDRGAVVPVRLLAEQWGAGMTFKALLSRLRCRHCGRFGAPVYLLSDLHRTFCYGADPQWTVELVPPAARAARQSSARSPSSPSSASK